MSYEIVGRHPSVIGSNNDLELIEARDLGKSPSACPPFKIGFDENCFLKPKEYENQRKVLCHRILDAIKLAEKASFKLESKPIRSATVDKFKKIFGQDPDAL